MIWNLFKKKDNEPQEENSIEQRIDEAIKKAELGKRNEDNEIKSIISLAKDAIIDTYIEFFPNAQYSYYRDQHKETALEKYEEIKKEHAGKLSPEIAEKCDKIVNGYLNQAKMRESKIQFYDKLLTEYEATKQKLAAARERADRMEKLNKHSEKLREMDDDSGELAESYQAEYEFEDIQKDFELKQEYYNQVEQLSLEYNKDESSFDNSLAYKEEVDKMLKKF